MDVNLTLVALFAALICSACLIPKFTAWLWRADSRRKALVSALRDRWLGAKPRRAGGVALLWVALALCRFWRVGNGGLVRYGCRRRAF